MVHGFTGYEPSDRPAWAWDWLPTDNNISTFIPYKYTPADLVTKEAPSNALEREARKLLKVMNSGAAPKSKIPVPRKLNDKRPILDARE